MGQTKEAMSRLLTAVERIAAIIDVEKKEITNRELIKLCSTAGIECLSTDPHLCHELAEAALNHLIRTKYGKILLDSPDPAKACIDVLRTLQKRLPTQTWRSSAQITYQQFSTPPPIAYLAAYLLILNNGDVVLEPSCGTSSLAVWAKAAGATVVTNEIDPRRRQLAELLGFRPTAHDAEFIDDFLPESFAPNAVLINPPFSSSGGRVERNRNSFGFRHVESALRRLGTGGRFAVMLGESGSPNTFAGKTFWQALTDIRPAAAIELPGSEYYRNGTTVGVTLILGRKLGKPLGDKSVSEDAVPTIVALSVEDAFEKVLAAGILLSPFFK